MKVTIGLDTNTDEGIDEWNMIKNMRDYYLAVEDIRTEIRRVIKYENVDDNTELILRNIQMMLPEEL